MFVVKDAYPLYSEIIITDVRHDRIDISYTWWLVYSLQWDHYRFRYNDKHSGFLIPSPLNEHMTTIYLVDIQIALKKFRLLFT